MMPTTLRPIAPALTPAPALMLALILTLILAPMLAGLPAPPASASPASVPPHPTTAPVTALDRTGRQWSDCLEWALTNPTWDGNPFDVLATATFTHETSGHTITTGMFFDPATQGQPAAWRFRFTGTRPGRWTFHTTSDDPDLDGHAGTATITANDDAYGFVVAHGNKWARQRGRDGEPEAFVPQYVMFGTPRDLHQQPDKMKTAIDAAIETFLVRHGFTGFHTMVFCQWFDLDRDRADQIDDPDPNPDPRTFEALETLIRKTHAADGVVHVWIWGDQQRTQTPVKWGLNRTVDRRLQRYIAARLGPLPGWTAGYGFDLWEWVDASQLNDWHGYMHEQFGWPHLLGARARGRQRGRLTQLSPAMDYASFEEHRPSLDTYRRMLNDWPDKPAFAEDRFRIRDVNRYRDKDYNEVMTRRGLWHATMAGGVANIWGHLRPPADSPLQPSNDTSFPYPHAHWIRTWADFVAPRFAHDMNASDDFSDRPTLASGDGQRLIFYREDAAAVRMDLTHLRQPIRAIAIDTTQPYREIDLGPLPPGRHVWSAPRLSDWAVAVGAFPGTADVATEDNQTHAPAPRATP